MLFSGWFSHCGDNVLIFIKYFLKDKKKGK